MKLNFTDIIRKYAVGSLIWIAGLFVFLYFLWVGMRVLWILLISWVILYFLGRWRNVFSYIITVIIITFNLTLLFFSLLPSYDKEINLEEFYQQQQNYISAEIKDEPATLQSQLVKVKINNTSYDLPQLKNISIKKWDIVTFQSRTKNIESIVSIYLWDGTILRLLPQTTVSMDEITKNLNDVTTSQTRVNLQKWDIWFHVIKTLINDDGFQVTTSNWSMVIRWTSWIIWHNRPAWSTWYDSYVQSADHLIEVKPLSWQSMFITRNQVVQFNTTNIKDILTQQLRNFLWDTAYAQIATFKILDNQDIKNYKEKFTWYIRTKYSEYYEISKSFQDINYWKLWLFSMWDQSSHNELQNYYVYQTLMGNNDYSSKFDQETIKKAIFTPINDNLEKIKSSYLFEKATQDTQALKSYAFDKINSILDSGKDIDKEKLQNLWRSIQAGDAVNIIRDLMITF